MTIAIGAKYPWGELNRLPPPDSKISEAIVLASDSRFSRKLSHSYVPTSDSGTKLFQLGNDAVAVYAGNSNAVEHCLDELRWRLSRQNRPNSNTSKRIAQETFQDVYRHQIALMRLNPDEAPLYIIIGACNKKGKAELYRFRYNTGFIPEAINGLEAIGFEETVSVFKGLLENELHKQVEDELSLRYRYPQIPMASMVPMPIKDGHVAILITGILNKIIESDSDTTIGGMVQCALINTEGVSFPTISYTTDPTNEGPGWTRATASPNELTTVTGISGVFGCYDLSD